MQVVYMQFVVFYKEINFFYKQCLGDINYLVVIKVGVFFLSFNDIYCYLKLGVRLILYVICKFNNFYLIYIKCEEIIQLSFIQYC